MGELVGHQPTASEIDISIRTKENEAWSHEHVAEQYEQRAKKHRDFAEQYRTQANELRASLLAVDIPTPVEVTEDETRTPEMTFEGPAENFS
jgi:hypothetical protein